MKAHSNKPLSAPATALTFALAFAALLAGCDRELELGFGPEDSGAALDGGDASSDSGSDGGPDGSAENGPIDRK